MIREEVNQGASFRYIWIIPQNAEKVKGFLEKRQEIKKRTPRRDSFDTAFFGVLGNQLSSCLPKNPAAVRISLVSTSPPGISRRVSPG